MGWVWGGMDECCGVRMAGSGCTREGNDEKVVGGGWVEGGWLVVGGVAGSGWCTRGEVISIVVGGGGGETLSG